MMQEHKTKIQNIYSEAFPIEKSGQRKKIASVSSYHKLLEDIQINCNDIQYKSLSIKDIDEIIKLHKEWFPIEYEAKWFDKVLTNKDGSYFTIGAYYTITNKNNESKEVILGLSLCQYRYVSDYFINHTSKDVVREICKNIDFNEEVEAWIKCQDYICSYIMTIGVLDECRQLGIGSRLIKEIINKTMDDNLAVGVYLDVIIYNNMAIKFYEKNGFTNVSTIKNYYNIKNELYDSKVFLIFFTRKEKDEYRAKKYSLLRKIVNILIIYPFNFIYKIIIFIFFFQCFRDKIKVD